jgi:hypothetical protein
MRMISYLKEPKRKVSKVEVAKEETSVKFGGGIPVVASENDELWKIASSSKD